MGLVTKHLPRLMCLMILFTLASCGGGSSTGQSTNKSDSGQTTNQTSNNDSSDTNSAFSEAEIALMLKGKSIYEGKCQACHGEKGMGDIGGSLVHSYDLTLLTNIVTTTMPPTGAKCVGECASSVSLWIAKGFPTLTQPSGSTGSNAGNGNNTDNNTGSIEEVPLDPNLAKGKDYYDAQCLSCHGNDGAGATPILSCEAKDRCSNQAALTSYIAKAMPPGATHYTGEKADLTARYILEVLFNHDNNVDVPYSTDNIQVKNWQETLYKTSLNLIGRLPTAQEKTNAKDEAGYNAVVQGYLAMPEFYARLKDMFNDTYLVRGASNVADKISTTNFPNARWYDMDALVSPLNLNADINTAKDMAKTATERALKEEVLELVKYVVQNDKPFSEILTAEYLMVNPFSARTYGVYDQVTWSTPNSIEALEFKPTKLTLANYTHSGLLNAFPFLITYPDTSTNRNRHRARYIFNFFLDKDIMLVGSRLTDSNAVSGANPTKDDPSCNICHNTIDPVASLLFNFQGAVTFNATRMSPADMLKGGLNGVEMPSSFATKKLSWLSAEIIKDPAFARSIVRTAYKGLTGHELMKPGLTRTDYELSAYIKQEEMIESLASKFRIGFNFKQLMLDLTKTVYYRAKSLAAIAGDTSAYRESSASRPLSPEILSAKLISSVGLKWTGNIQGSGTDKILDRGGNGYFSYLGGIDSSNTIVRPLDSNSLMHASHKRLAVEMSCLVTARDFFLAPTSRNLLSLVERTTVPFDVSGNAVEANQTLIKKNIIQLFSKLHGVTLAENDPEVLEVLNVFNNTFKKGQAKIKAAPTNAALKSLPSMCQVNNDPITGVALTRGQTRTDDNYVIRSWMSVMYYLLSDRNFNYE